MPPIHRLAPTIDLVLLSHGDLAHTGLFPYAFCRWGLKAPCYSTLPVQAMARIAVTEDVEGLRDEQEMDDSDMGDGMNDLPPSEAENLRAVDPGGEPMDGRGITPSAKEPKRKFVATIHEVNEAFDSVNTLRYSQPTHLQGNSSSSLHRHLCRSPITQGNVKASLSPPSAPATPSAAQSGRFALLQPER